MFDNSRPEYATGDEAFLSPQHNNPPFILHLSHTQSYWNHSKHSRSGGEQEAFPTPMHNPPKWNETLFFCFFKPWHIRHFGPKCWDVPAQSQELEYNFDTVSGLDLICSSCTSPPNFSGNKTGFESASPSPTGQGQAFLGGVLHDAQV